MSDPIVLTIFVCAVIAMFAIGALAVFVLVYERTERPDNASPQYFPRLPKHPSDDDAYRHHPKRPPSR